MNDDWLCDLFVSSCFVWIISTSTNFPSAVCPHTHRRATVGGGRRRHLRLDLIGGARTCPLPAARRARSRCSRGAAGPLNPRVIQESGLARSQSSKCGANRRGAAASVPVFVFSHPPPPPTARLGTEGRVKTLEINTPESKGRIQVAAKTRRVSS